LKEHIELLPAEPAEESERNGKESCRAICGRSGRDQCFNILNHADAASARHLLGKLLTITPSLAASDDCLMMGRFIVRRWKRL
jgi:hypothetical protein